MNIIFSETTQPILETPNRIVENLVNSLGHMNKMAATSIYHKISLKPS